MNNQYPTFPLGKAEWSKIYSEISSNYGKYKGQVYATHKSYAPDGRAYWYMFENHGFGDYNIYLRVEAD